MTDDEHRLANAEPTTQPAEQDGPQAGGTGVYDAYPDIGGDMERATMVALDRALENYPGEPDGEVTVTVTVTDA